MFEITITETKTERKVVRGEHTVVERRPYTEAEVNEAGAYFRQSLTKDISDLKPIYGYAPPREEDVETEREILKQTVESLDLAAVIKAINQL